MPFILHLGDWKFKVKNEDRERLNELRQRYEGKHYQTSEELRRARENLNRELKAITGKEILKSGCKYGANTSAAINGALTRLVACAATAEEKNKWELLLNEFTNVREHAETTTADDEKSAGVEVRQTSDNMAGTPIRYYSNSENVERYYTNIINKINTAARGDLEQMVTHGTDYNNDSIRRDNLEILYQYTVGALNGSLEEEAAKSEEYLLGDSINSSIPGIQDYGVGLKPGKKPYMSDYARLEHLVPIHTTAVKALRLMNGNIAYQNSYMRDAGNEYQIRDLILSEASEALYAIDKIRKNVQNNRVLTAFPKELEKASLNSPENLAKYDAFESLYRAKRQLVINGWAMADINAIGRLASLFPTDNKALDSLKTRVDDVIKTAPGNEEKRSELLNSLIQEIDKLPENVREQVKPLSEIRGELERAANKELTDTEKKYLNDPSIFKDIAAAHPIRQYTQSEQEKDLNWLSEIERKDKELNDIFKTDPYAHDKIRELQAAAGDNPGIIAEAVKKVIGEKAWNAYRPVEGREKDDLKAIDILTHPDSRHNVKGNHKLLNDVEKAVRMRLIDIPKKNYSYLGHKEMSDCGSNCINLLYAASPGIDGDNVAANIQVESNEAGGARRQNEYIERLNKVLDSPGDMDIMQQRREIGICITGILTPITSQCAGFNPNEQLFFKENLSPEEMKQLETSILEIKGTKGYHISKLYGDKVLQAFAAADKGIEKLESLMMESGHEVCAVNLLPVKVQVKNALKGVEAKKIRAIDPVINIVAANMKAPTALEIDRQKTPIVPGQTNDFSFKETEEKKDIFPIHKVIAAENELQLIWGDYLAERKNGPLSEDKEKDYWKKINDCYTTIETITDDLIEKQEKSGGTFAAEHMRFMTGMGSVNDSYRDVLVGPRGIKPKNRFIKGRREAVANGWPLSELGLYSHLEETAANIDDQIENVAKFPGTEEYVSKAKELRDLLKEKIIGKEYEKDPSVRAELYRDLNKKLSWLSDEKERLRSEVQFDKDPGVDAKKKIVLDSSFIFNLDVNASHNYGGMPITLEVEICQKEAEVAAIEAVKNEVESLKDIADPIVYNELKEYIKESYKPPVQDYTCIDTEFSEKGDLYIESIGDLTREMNVISRGEETTLRGKTELTQEQAVGRIRDMLNASDSMFHFDSKQYKVIKEDLERVCSGNCTDKDREKLTKDVKDWITDPEYDRVNKHSKNQFDNTRFNLMFTLANELDPKWAKENFQDMNLSAFHGEKAVESSFYNVHEYMNFMHRQMANGGFLRGAGPITSRHWYQKSDNYGQNSLVNEVLRLRDDASISEDDKLSVELSNIDKLMGIGEKSRLDNDMIDAFTSLRQYRNDLVSVLKTNPFEGWANDGEVIGKFVSNVNLDQLRKINLDTAKISKQNAIAEVKRYLDNPEKHNDRMYDKVVLAYGVLDPKGAHDHILKLNEKRLGDKKVKPISLPELEKKQGIDFGGHKELNRKKFERAAQKKAPTKDNKGPEMGALSRSS